MKHKIRIDNIPFKRKPEGPVVGGIQNRIAEKNSVKNLGIEEIANLVGNKGYTMKSFYGTGTKNSGFKSASIICIDIDNDYKVKETKGVKGEEKEVIVTYKATGDDYTSLDDFINNIDNLEYKPAVIYKTFSHNDKNGDTDWNRYRLIFQLDQEIYKAEELQYIYSLIGSQFKNIDTVVNWGSLSYGGKGVAYLNKDNIINVSNLKLEQVDLEEIKKLLDENNKKKKDTKTTTSKVSYEKEIFTEEIIIERIKTLKPNFKNLKIEYKDFPKWIDENIKLTLILNKEPNERFRCVFPGHEDKHPSARISDEMTDGIQRYICSREDEFGLKSSDVIKKILRISISLVCHKVSKALNIQLGSDYQRDMLVYLMDIKRNLHYYLSEETVVGAYLRKRKLFQLYEDVILDFAMTSITMTPLCGEDDLTFFISNTELSKIMIRKNIKGAGSINRKINALKEIGLIVELDDSEIDSFKLAEANKYKYEAMKKHNFKYCNRVAFYKLSDLGEETISNAEEIISKLKQIKVADSNVRRRSNVLGIDKAKDINKQLDVEKILSNKKSLRDSQNVADAIQEVLSEYDYFTEDMLVKYFKPYKNKKVKKNTAKKIVNDWLVLYLSSEVIKKSPLNNNLRSLLNVNKNIKSRTIIYYKITNNNS